jgi:outer membrane receptor protein involved in Fe transport
MLRIPMIFLLTAWVVLARAEVAPLSGLALSPGSIKVLGRVLDGKDQRPIEFATVVIRTEPDSALVQGAVTDSAGYFRLEKLPPGSYQISISYLGYQPYLSKSFTLLQDSPQLDVGNIRLVLSEQMLAEVVVHGERPLVEHQMGKLVVNVSTGAFKTATTAVDVLARSPGLLVDRDGQITVRGMYSPRMMLEGKPISAGELKTIPAGDIDRLEIITNPSAQYEGDSQAVVNIILKKDTTLGWKANLFAEYAQNVYMRHEEGGQLSYKTKRALFYGRYEYFKYNFFRNTETIRKIGEEDQADQFEQLSREKTTAGGHFYRAGADYYPRKNHELGVMFRGSSYVTGALNTVTTTVNDAASIFSLSNSPATRDNAALNLSYKINFSNSGSLVSYLDYFRFGSVQRQQFTALTDAADALEPEVPPRFSNRSQSLLNVASFKSDYVHPLKNGARIELGVKGTWSGSDNYWQLMTDTDGAGPQALPSADTFKYHEQVTAGYGVFGHTLGKLQFQAGLRAEHTRTRNESVTLDNVWLRRYWTLLPSLNLQSALGNNSSISGGYTRRLRRPLYQDLNPFRFFLDSYSYFEGNPFLKPSITDQVEAAYHRGDFHISMFYRHEKNLVKQLSEQEGDSRVVAYKVRNVDYLNTTGVDVNYTHKITDWWKVQSYLVVKYDQFRTRVMGADFASQMVSYVFRATSGFVLPAAINAECNFFYNSRGLESIYDVAPYYAFGAGLQRSFFKDRADVKVNYSDIFYTQKQQFTTSLPGFYTRFTQRNSSRELTVRLTYRLGRSTFNHRSRSAGTADEESRVK